MVRILCIDDNRHGCFVRKSMLEEQGYEVKVALGGREGLEALEAEKFDLVVVDYVMPVMNGGEVIRQIRESGSKIPIILHSGFTEKLALDERRIGADAVLEKGPREIKELLETVKRLVSKRSQKPKKPAGRARKATTKAAPGRRDRRRKLS